MDLKENKRMYRREGREKLCNYSIISNLKEIIFKEELFLIIFYFLIEFGV